jgi:hypothetical protein
MLKIFFYKDLSTMNFKSANPYPGRKVVTRGIYKTLSHSVIGGRFKNAIEGTLWVIY